MAAFIRHSATWLLACLFAIALLPPALPYSARAECVPYGDYFHWVNIQPLPHAAYRQAVSGGRIYMCAGSSGLMIYDVSQPSDIRELSILDTPGSCSDVAVSGNTVFLADGASGLQTVDVSDPEAPQIVGTFVPGSISHIELDETTLAAVGGGQFYLIDVSDPMNPSLIGSTPSAGAYDLKFGAGHVYTGGSGAMRIIDITDPAHPAEVGQYPVTGLVSGLGVVGSHVLLANPGAGFESSYNFMVDVSDPTLPVTVWTDYGYIYAFEVLIVGQTAFFYSGGNLQVYDVSDPTSPQPIRSLYPYYYGYLSVDDGYLYNTHYYGVEVVDISTFSTFDPLASVPAPYPEALTVSGGRSYSVAYAFNRAYLDIVDLSDPLTPTWLGNLEMNVGGRPLGVDVSGDFAYVAQTKWSIVGANGLTVVNVSNPAVPTVAAFRTTVDEASDVVIASNRAYVAVADSGVTVFNVQTPAAPVFITRMPTPGRAQAVAVWGSLLYVAAGDAGVLIVDIANPDAPAIIGTADTPGDAAAVTIDGSLAFVADGGSLQIVDVSNPVSPTLLGRHFTQCYSLSAIAVADDIAYVVDGCNVVAFDVSDPSVPKLIGARSGDSYAGVAALNDLLVVGNSRDGSLDILPVHCPTSGAALNPPGRATGLRLSPPFPNPSSGAVAMTVLLPARGLYETTVIDVGGRVVRHLDRFTAEASGERPLVWDGRDDAGRESPSGLYFIRISGRTGAGARKILLNR